MILATIVKLFSQHEHEPIDYFTAHVFLVLMSQKINVSNAIFFNVVSKAIVSKVFLSIVVVPFLKKFEKVVSLRTISVRFGYIVN